jgi:hypothetical protein
VRLVRRAEDMKRQISCIAALVALGLAQASGAMAQEAAHWRGGGGWEPGSQYNRSYKVATVETVSGVVVRLERLTPKTGMCSGIRLVLKTNKETLPVHLGPAWFVENQDTRIKPNDTVEVTGSRIAFDGVPTIIAASVMRGNDLLSLRDMDGRPHWSAWRHW